jgi:5-methylcytosine-specific restriction endonuclease McrA
VLAAWSAVVIGPIPVGALSGQDCARPPRCPYRSSTSERISCEHRFDCRQDRLALQLRAGAVLDRGAARGASAGAALSRFTPRSRAYRVLAAQVKAQEPNCRLCGVEIDAWRRKPDPMAFQCDHIIPARLRPDLAEVRSNLRATHARCNRDRERKTPRPRPGLYVSLDEF